MLISSAARPEPVQGPPRARVAPRYYRNDPTVWREGPEFDSALPQAVTHTLVFLKVIQCSVSLAVIQSFGQVADSKRPRPPHWLHQVDYHMTVQQSSTKKVTQDPRDFWSKTGHEVIKVRVAGGQWVGPRGSGKGRPKTCSLVNPLNQLCTQYCPQLCNGQ